MSKVIKIAGNQVASGQRRSINIPVARLYTHTEMTIPVHVLRGKKDGPRLFVCAAIHGDEIIGVEIIRRLLKMKILKRLCGTLIAVPVVVYSARPFFTTVSSFTDTCPDPSGIWTSARLPGGTTRW